MLIEPTIRKAIWDVATEAVNSHVYSPYYREDFERCLKRDFLGQNSNKSKRTFFSVRFTFEEDIQYLLYKTYFYLLHARIGSDGLNLDEKMRQLQADFKKAKTKFTSSTFLWISFKNLFNHIFRSPVASNLKQNGMLSSIFFIFMFVAGGVVVAWPLFLGLLVPLAMLIYSVRSNLKQRDAALKEAECLFEEGMNEIQKTIGLQKTPVTTESKAYNGLGKRLAEENHRFAVYLPIPNEPLVKIVTSIVEDYMEKTIYCGILKTAHCLEAEHFLRLLKTMEEKTEEDSDKYAKVAMFTAVATYVFSQYLQSECSDHLLPKLSRIMKENEYNPFFAYIQTNFNETVSLVFQHINKSKPEAGFDVEYIHNTFYKEFEAGVTTNNQAGFAHLQIAQPPVFHTISFRR